MCATSLSEQDLRSRLTGLSLGGGSVRASPVHGGGGDSSADPAAGLNEEAQVRGADAGRARACSLAREAPGGVGEDRRVGLWVRQGSCRLGRAHAPSGVAASPAPHTPGHGGLHPLPSRVQARRLERQPLPPGPDGSHLGIGSFGAGALQAASATAGAPPLPGSSRRPRRPVLARQQAATQPQQVDMRHPGPAGTRALPPPRP
jgi:hypothetical protein